LQKGPPQKLQKMTAKKQTPKKAKSKKTPVAKTTFFLRSRGTVVRPGDELTAAEVKNLPTFYFE